MLNLLALDPWWRADLLDIKSWIWRTSREKQVLWGKAMSAWCVQVCICLLAVLVPHRLYHFLSINRSLSLTLLPLSLCFRIFRLKWLYTILGVVLKLANTLFPSKLLWVPKYLLGKWKTFNLGYLIMYIIRPSAYFLFSTLHIYRLILLFSSHALCTVA